MRTQSNPSPARGRPFLQVLFACCQVYQRVYRNPNKPEYSGRCPRCLRSVHFRVGPEGTEARVFEVF